MRVYADYAYYRDVFLGETVPEEEFLWISRRASFELDRMCFGRILEATEAVKDACCAVCEVLYDGVERGGAEIQRVLRERVGDLDVAYAAPEITGIRGRMRDAAALYLWPTTLLSRAAPYREGTKGGAVPWNPA